MLGDLACLEADAIVTDPPYGVGNNNRYSRFSGGQAKLHRGRDYRPIVGDDQPFDPSPWLGFPKVLLFGFNCFSHRLPMGSLLIWCKRRDSVLGKFLSDCEVAWFNRGRGIYLFHHEWSGFMRESERGKSLHPTQKPVALMKWCIERMRLRPGSTIVDPYMGSGSTGVAALEMGHKFIGVECDAGYFATAAKRLKKVSKSN